MKKSRLTGLLTLARLFRPANATQFCAYLRKYGLRLCVARTIFILSLALGLRDSKPSPASKRPVHKIGRNEEPLKRLVPDGPPLLDGSQDILRLELAELKENLANNVQRTRKAGG